MKVMVTGASAGFGAAIARAFIAKGHTVIGTGRRQDKLDTLKSELGDNFVPLSFDISDVAATKAAVESLPEALQTLDVLVNNAGLAIGLETADKSDMSEWQQMIDTNVTGLCNITQLLLPKMVAANTGYIINIGSTAGTYPYAGGNVYGATKAFVRQFSLNLRADLIGTALRVTNVEPGLCEGTEFSNVRFRGDDQKAANVYKDVDAIRPEDIANIVLWLTEQPKHVNINAIEVMPTAQSFAPLHIQRQAL
ncbi:MULTISPECIES: SDR family oxidoreductase [unclassified Psychrobacter]|uniref:SDR family oxidoreductase n=1 Tax=unclassified Psychrobacter TaxID=196806 RepID=UPI0018F69C76|nr:MULTISPECIES: SDR family oxidoreductase [unclassified Psychrobacter]